MAILSLCNHYELFANSPIIAEALAFRAALNHAVSLGWKKIKINSDAQSIIRTINIAKIKSKRNMVSYVISTLSHLYFYVFLSRISRDPQMCWPTRLQRRFSTTLQTLLCKSFNLMNELFKKKNVALDFSLQFATDEYIFSITNWLWITSTQATDFFL